MQQVAKNKIGSVENQELLNIVLSASRLGTWELNLQNSEFFFSDRYKEILGHAADSKVGYADFVKQVHPDDLPTRTMEHQRAFKTGILNYQTRIIWPDGSIHWVEGIGKVFYDDQRQPVKMVGTIRDITTEREHQHELLQRERKFRNTVLQVPIGITIFRGKEFLVEMANQAYLDIIDRKENELVGRPLFEAMPEVRSAVEPLLRNVYETGTPYYGNEFESPINRQGRTDTAYFNFVYYPSRDANGEVNGIIVVATEVTEQVQAKKRLEESERQFRNFVTRSPIAMTIFRGPDFIIDMANEELLKNIWRKEANEVMNKRLLDVFPELREQRFPELLQRVMRERIIHRENEALALVQGNDGMKEFYLDFEYAPLFGKNNEVSGVMVTVYNVTDRVLARKKIEQTEEKFRLLTGLMPQMIWTSDAAGNLNYFSQSVTDYTGLSLEELINDGWINVVHPSERDENVHRWLRSISTGKDFLFEHRFLGKDGQYRWQLSRAVPQYNSDGSIQMWVGTSTDIHDQKTFSAELEKQVEQRTSELKKSNEQLSKSNADLEQFAYIASHDLQEPLRKIKTFISLLHNNYSSEEERSVYFEKITASATKMSTLIKNVLDYSRLSKPEEGYQSTNVEKIIAEVQDDVELRIIEKNAQIVVHALPRVIAIPYQLRQVFFNLISNSLKFSAVAPVIEISSRPVSPEEWEHISGSPTTHEYSRISIKDNGIGFDQKYAEQIFTIFQRLNDNRSYHGTGIGLAMCRRILENHQGMIYAESKEGEGSTFHIYLKTAPAS